jgi:hypothetical protein
MFLKQYFYHSHVRKAIIAFGTIFNQIEIKRKDTDGNYLQSLRVPLSYSPKQKFIARIAAQSDVETRSTAISLPRIGFEMTGLTYDPTRRLGMVQKNVNTNSTYSDSVQTQYTSTPFNMTIAMYAFAKNQDDGLQIVEQILPFFNPDFTVSINDIPEMGIKRDLQILLDGVSYEDDYAGDFLARRSVIWNLNFTMKLNFYGPVSNQGYIKTAIAKTYTSMDTTSTVSDKYTVTYTPDPSLPTDNWEYVEQFDESYNDE